MLLLDTNYDGAFVDSIHLPICPKKYWVLLCMIDFEEILGDWVSLNWGMEFKPHYDIFRTPLWKQVSSVWAPPPNSEAPSPLKTEPSFIQNWSPFPRNDFYKKIQASKTGINICVSLFFICYFATSQSTLGHYWWDTGTLTQWSITAILSIFIQKVVGFGNPGVLCTLKL